MVELLGLNRETSPDLHWHISHRGVKTLFETTLIEEFEDDAPRAADEAEHKFTVVEEDSVDDEIETDSTEAEASTDEKEEEAGLLAEEENESWSDDPVRMYLTQMGEIPLLTRQEEISLAKKIEVTRARFRGLLIECDYVAQSAYKVLKRVHLGELPFDRTVQVSVTDHLEKDQILGRLPHNLATLNVLLLRNRRDYTLGHPQVAVEDEAPTGVEAVGAAASPGGEVDGGVGSADAAHRTDDPHAGRVQPPGRRVERPHRRA